MNLQSSLSSDSSLAATKAQSMTGIMGCPLLFILRIMLTFVICFILKIPIHTVYKFISSFGRAYLQYLENQLESLEEAQSTSPLPSLLTVITSLEVLQNHPQFW